MIKINPTNEIKIKDVFVNSWGYDQTNIDFYQVVRKTKRCVFIRKIESIKEDDPQTMTGKSMPKLNSFNGAEIKKIPYKYTETDYCLKGIYINFEFGCGHLWNGRSEQYSTYA